MSWLVDLPEAVAPGAFDAAVDYLEVPLYGSPEEIEGRRNQVIIAKQAAKLLRRALDVSPGQLLTVHFYGHFQGPGGPTSCPSSIGVNVYAVNRP